MKSICKSYLNCLLTAYTLTSPAATISRILLMTLGCSLPAPLSCPLSGGSGGVSGSGAGGIIGTGW